MTNTMIKGVSAMPRVRVIFLRLPAVKTALRHSLAILLLHLGVGVIVARADSGVDLTDKVSVATVGGELVVKMPVEEDEDRITKLMLNDKIVEKFESWVSLAYKAHIGDKDVVLVRISMGAASACYDTYTLYIISANGEIRAAEESPDSCNATIAATSDALAITSKLIDGRKFTTVVTTYTKDGITVKDGPAGSVDDASAEKSRLSSLLPEKHGVAAFDSIGGKGPAALLKDPEFGPVLERITPSEIKGCRDEYFNYAIDLTKQPDGTLSSKETGCGDSCMRTDKNLIGYVGVTKDGRVDIVLDCRGGNWGYADFLWFSSAPIETNGTPDLIEWAKLVVIKGEPAMVRQGEGFQRRFIPDIVEKGDLSSPNIVQLKEQKAARDAVRAKKPGVSFAKAGAWVCVNAKSFYKVRALEATGNMYAQMPQDCGRLGDIAEVYIQSTFHDPVVGDMTLISNDGGAVYIRRRDLD